MSSATSPYPINTNTSRVSYTVSPVLSSASSTASSISESEQDLSRPTSRRTRVERPKMSDRHKSTSSIVPKGSETYLRDSPQYPPNDARGMSPRRSSHDTERMSGNVRQSLKNQARTLQSSLAALAERIDEVKSDHDKLESENKFLQDYIGGLTRNMARDGLGGSGSTTKKSRK